MASAWLLIRSYPAQVTGKYSGGGHAAFLPFTLRFYISAGATAVRMVHFFIYDGDQFKDFIKAIVRTPSHRAHIYLPNLLRVLRSQHPSPTNSTTATSALSPLTEASGANQSASFLAFAAMPRLLYSHHSSTAKRSRIFPPGRRRCPPESTNCLYGLITHWIS